MAFPRLSDLVVYPPDFPGAGRKDDQKWAVRGVGAATLQCGMCEERRGQVENKLSHLSWSQVSASG